jgi:hypothetical protein
MRFIKTFILRLYIDPEMPEQLCGEVHPVEETGNHPFKNRTEFEELLQRLIRKPPTSMTGSSSADTDPAA